MNERPSKFWVVYVKNFETMQQLQRNLMLELWGWFIYEFAKLTSLLQQFMIPSSH
jgi:hypothetical protein